MASYSYVGGPCAGKTVSFTPALPDGDVVNCGGASYQFNAGNPGVLVWLDTGPFPGSGDTLGSKAPKGWHDLQVAVNQRTPTALAKAQRLRRAAHRKVRRALH